jgi:hypothetical protein
MRRAHYAWTKNYYVLCILECFIKYVTPWNRILLEKLRKSKNRPRSIKPSITLFVRFRNLTIRSSINPADAPNSIYWRCIFKIISKEVCFLSDSPPKRFMHFSSPYVPYIHLILYALITWIMFRWESLIMKLFIIILFFF